MSAFDVERIRKDFPLLQQTARGKPLVYLDSAATAQKPQAVIDAVAGYYTRDNANVHRAVYELAERSTRAYEGARAKARDFLGAGSEREIVFVRGATEGINLVANTLGRQRIGAGDEVLVTGMEHHSNIVPWQLVCEERGARLVVAPLDDDGQISLADVQERIGERTKFVALVHVSNALGTINPVRDVVALAHRRGIPVLVDGAQAVPHQAVDVRDLDCDFYVLSGHKLFGPTGVGVLYGKAEWLEAMPPWQGGGEMIASVSFEKTTYADIPYKFEAGTPNMAGCVGLGAAIDYVSGIGLDRIAAYEHELLGYATEALLAVPGLRLIGTARKKAAVLSFVLDGVHPHDVGTILDGEGVAVRTGHHCAQPVMERFGVPATARASLAFYNTSADIDALVAGLAKVRELFA